MKWTTHRDHVTFEGTPEEAMAFMAAFWPVQQAVARQPVAAEIRKIQLGKTADYEHLLGTMPDIAIARRFNIAPSSVGRARRLRKIPMFRGAR